MTSKSSTDRFLALIGKAIGPQPDGTVLLHAPSFSGNELKYLKECIDTGWVSSVGKFVDTFEAKLAEYAGSKFAVVVSNGTSALQVALWLAGVKANTEVVVPALSFVATANAVAHCGATPHFVDSSEITLGICPIALERHLRETFVLESGRWKNRHTGRFLSAIVPMHTFGHPVDIDSILEIGRSFSIPIVEDAAESLGSLYKGRHTGTFGKLGVLSFNGNKIITTGGGGAILTDDELLAKRAKHITTTAKRPHAWEFIHDEVAWNFRLPNLNAAVGVAQLERLNQMIEQKRALAGAYERVFTAESDFRFFSEPLGCRSNYWLNVVTLAEDIRASRNDFLAAANDAGFQCRPVWRLLSTLPMFVDCPRAPLPIAEVLESSILNLPSSAFLSPVAD